MNLAKTILHDVSAMGGLLTAKDGRLKITAPTPLPQALLERVRAAKPVLLEALQLTHWTDTDWQEYYDERAGIAEYDGRTSREKAEQQAYEACITRWLNMYPQSQSNPDVCPHCNKPNGTPGEQSIAVLNGGESHLWLHSTCLAAWQERRVQQAIDALTLNGITQLRNG